MSKQDAHVSKVREIQRAAERMFAVKGYEATGIRDLAVATGLSLSSLYHYIESKEQLLLSIMSRSLGCSMTAVRQACDTALSPEARLVAFVRTHAIVEGSFPEEALVVDGELRALGPDARREVVRLRDAYEGVLDRILTDGVDSGVFRLANQPLTRLALLEVGNGLSRWFSDRGPSSLTEIADSLSDLALLMVQASRDGQQLQLRDLGLPDCEVYRALVVETYERADSVLPEATEAPGP